MRSLSYRNLLILVVLLSTVTALFAPGPSVSTASANFYLPSHNSEATLINASPALTVTPASLSFTATQAASPVSQTVNLDSGSGNITFTTSSSASWLSVNPSAGTVISGTSFPLTVTANPAGLSHNVYTATLLITDTANSSNNLSLPVTLTVTAPVTPTSYTYNLPFLANQYAPSPSISGSFTSYLAFQNVGGADANVNITYYDAYGVPITNSAVITTVKKYGEILPPNPAISGTKASGVITSDQPLNVLVSERTPYGGSSYAVGAGASSQLIAPLILNNFYGGFTTQLTVLNAGSSAVTATVDIYDENGTLQNAASKVITLAAHTATTLDQGDPASGLPASFNGWAKITGSAGSQLVAQMLEQNPSNHFAALVNARSAASPTQYAPAVFNGAYGGFVTGANVVNPNNTPVTVTINYYDYNGTAYPAPPFTVTANSVVGVYQPATDAYRGIPRGGLPANFAGGAIITATDGGVVVMVNELGGNTASGAARSGTYSAVSSGSSMLGLPAVANGGLGFNSGATLFNVSNAPVSGTVQYYNLDGSAVGSAQAFVIPGATGSSVVPNANLPTNFYGTAIVTQTSGPANSLVATANMQSYNFFYSYTEPTQ